MRHDLVPHRETGFTLRELIVVLVLVGVLAAIFWPALLRARRGACQIKDAAQVREIHKSFVLWAQTNDDLFPLPSLFDRDDATVLVTGDQTLKDSTGAVYSMLIFNDLLEPEFLISPDWREARRRIRIHRDYAHEAPALANDPENARWDPSFRGTPLDDTPGLSKRQRKISHASFAHLALAGSGRLEEWSNSLSSNYAAVGSRGPEETGGTWDPETGDLTATTLADGPTGTKSITLLIHGAESVWEGNIAYNDNHVNFETSTYPDGMLYTVGECDETQAFGDGLFLDEADPSVLSSGAMEDTRDSNCYLGLFRRGPTEAERVEHAQAVKFIKQARWFDGMTE
jgi:prepilin-type N-terminal cleavage/methylation domain-containing protein